METTVSVSLTGALAEAPAPPARRPAPAGAAPRSEWGGPTQKLLWVEVIPCALPTTRMQTTPTTPAFSIRALDFSWSWITLLGIKV